MAPDTPQEERRRRLSGKRREEPEDEVLLPTPPDGGWGWMVVFGSFIIHVIADGVAYSFGIFYIEFLEYFQAGRGPTGWIGSLMVGITWGSGEKIFFFLCGKMLSTQYEIDFAVVPQPFLCSYYGLYFKSYWNR